ncbi:Unconventional myosin-Va [Geodia barretti]|uniref:Unconventional myosin-Va n=1 Tax=Geodia barretti TaxID=519541 RepID=A0AA35THW5_GEOBA|nr:Unconventional myosin-Va [Geodia barretti]
MSTVDVPDLYCRGVRVWVPDRDRVWVGGEVVSVEGDEGGVVVRCEGEEETKLLGTKDSLPLLRNPQMLVGANDLTTLSYLHEPAVLHNLSVRFLHSKMIYTYCGIVLVALNPYQPLPIYGNETAAAYRGRDMGEMDPHIFAVAEEAFRKMTREGSDQSLIISGESGAGKTVSAKFVMRYFATVGGASTETQIERKVLASNPIMEAIGNAKTTRNDNSSRFGKYIEIRFDRTNRITGAHMRTYLLERSRVVTQATSERNYHIFYQLCAARDCPDMSDYHLGHAESFHYTSQGGRVAIDDVDDQSEFTATRDAMKLLGFNDDQLRGVFQVLSAVLHLGNVEVGRRSKGGDVMGEVGEGDESLVTSATLLGVDSAHLAHWLCHKKITTAREVYHKPLTHPQSITARDSLAKSLYSRLFDWIVNIINSTLSPSSSPSSSSSSSSRSSFIGVLDIYGFEVFQENNFEQFCINYANEKLQQQFNMHVFQLEQAEYVKEEIEWSFIDYYDNQPCIDLIENRLGILDLLDETYKMPGGCDSLFIQKLYDNHNTPSSTHFTKPRMSRSEFQVRHYAGPVQYQTRGFVDKNSEQVAEEHLLLLTGSSVPFMTSLYKSAKATPIQVTSSQDRGGRRKNGMKTVTKVTVGSQFRSSLRELMTTLNSTTPHYVRCIKSNDRKLPFVFDPQRAVQQLRACGVLETVRLSAAGYPSRWTYNEFFQRYRLLLASGQVRREDVRQMCEYILRISIQDSSQYRFGKTKLFFRAGQVAYLERLRSQRLHSASLCVQRRVRGWLRRAWYRRLRAATILTQARVRGLLARRLAETLRRTRAVVCLQRHTRGLVTRLQYQRLRNAAITTQALFRGRQARKRCVALLYDQKAVVLQKYVRGWLARVHYERTVQRIIFTQCCVRRWAARRERRRLKMEARSVTHLQGLNKGLEIKIIELQLRLDEGERERMAAQDLWNNQKVNYEQVNCCRVEMTETASAVLSH